MRAVIDKFQTNHYLNSGSFGVAATRFGNFSIQSSDLVICLGLRLSSQIVGGNLKTFCPNAKKIVVDMDPEEFWSQDRIDDAEHDGGNEYDEGILDGPLRTVPYDNDTKRL